MTELDRMKYDAWTRQLERMRAMQYAYNRKFFTLLLVSTVGAVGGLLLGTPWALLGVALGLVTTGVTASFFLHFCDFARVHARALEQRINRLLGERVLIASELEASYFYPHATPKFSGFVPGWPLTFFSAFTVHFSVLWTATAIGCFVQLLPLVSTGWWMGAAAAFGGWTAVNVGFLGHWFYSAAAERRMSRQLADAYGEA